MCLMELPQVSIYFKFSSEMLSRTSSHICGRWYLPIFLFRDGLFTLMYRASFMEVIPSKTFSWLPRTNIIGVIYRYKCDRVDCDEEYIGESARNFEESFKEHLKAPSPIHDHLNISGHAVTIDSFSILGREGQNLMRTISPNT